MENNRIAVIELSCFPSICFFRTLKPYGKVAFEGLESFPKQTYRNRFDILTSNGIQTINIPVKKFANNTPYREIEIDNSTDWQKMLLRSLKTAYAMSPYYEYYIPQIEQLLTENYGLLMEFNIETMKLLHNWLHISWDWELTNSFEKVYNNELYEDFRDLKTKKRKKIEDWNCDNPTYWQVFGKNFVKGLSVLDLIFCEGPLSPRYI